jgi:hypothetical protein
MTSLGRTMVAAAAGLLLTALPACDRNPFAKPTVRKLVNPAAGADRMRAMEIAGAYYEVGIKCETELHELEAHYMGAPLPPEEGGAGVVDGRLARVTDIVERLGVKDGKYRLIQAHQAWGFLARVYAGDAEAEAQLAASAEAAADRAPPSAVAPLLHAQLHATRLFDTLQMRPEAGLVLDAPQQALLAKFSAAVDGQLEDHLWTRLLFIKLRPWALAVDRLFAGDPAGAAAPLRQARDEYATRDQVAYLGALHHHAAGAFAEAVAAYDAMLESMEAKPAEEGKPRSRAQADRRWPIAFYNRAMARLALPEPDRAAAAQDLRAAAERWAKSSRAHHQALAEKAAAKAQALESE